MSEFKPQPIQNNPSNVYEKPVARMFDLYLTGDIKEAKEYQDWNQIMRSSSENDAIILHINSGGGDMFTCIQLLRSMADSPATIVASVEGMCMSAATLLFLSADVCEISEHSHFMFHTYNLTIFDTTRTFPKLPMTFAQEEVPKNEAPKS